MVPIGMMQNYGLGENKEKERKEMTKKQKQMKKTTHCGVHQVHFNKEHDLWGETFSNQKFGSLKLLTLVLNST